MKIRTTVDFPGAPQGSVLNLPDSRAVALVERGLAVPVYTRRAEATLCAQLTAKPSPR